MNKDNSILADEIISLYKECGNFSEVGRQYSLSPTKVKQIMLSEIKKKNHETPPFEEMDYEEFYNHMFYCIWEREV